MQWTDEQMMEALQNGAAADAAADAPEQAPASAQQVTPEGETQQATTEQVQPAEPVAPVQQNTETFDGGKFNPDELPAELQPAWKQLQAAFTQRTQQLAAERQQIAALGDPESLQQAVELYNRISDPSSWVQLHSELTQAMQAYGMTPAEAAQAATEAVAQQQHAAQPNLDPQEIDDPELAALHAQLQRQQSELEALKGSIQSDREAAQAEYERQAFLGEIQRMENAIRGAHPDWNDDKIQSVYELSSFYGGNLLQAAERLESLLASERELYLSQKATVQENTGRLVPPATASTQSQQVKVPETLEDAEAGAMEFFKQQLAHYDG